MKRHLPSFLTCLNLLCGCVAVVLVFGNRMEWAACFVMAALIFDLLDGMLARLLNAYSEFGKQLDSLADMVSFGLVPGVFMFKIFLLPFNYLIEDGGVCSVALTFFPFLLTVFSALRLAKFNIDVRQGDSFIGLATPANTALTISWAMIILKDREPFAGWISNPWVLILFIVLQSYLLVAEIPMFSFKMKSFAWRGNEIRYIFLGIIIFFLLVFSYAGIPMIIFFYVLLSLLTNTRKQ
jgi:CDP-diacylglycerol--serine O-phosphatidyltransferase